MNEGVMLSALGIVGACVGGLIWVIKYQFEKILPAVEGLKNATESNTKATQTADRYLRERNGRDNAVHKELINSIKQIPSQVSQQHVSNQQVDNQTIAKKNKPS